MDDKFNNLESLKFSIYTISNRVLMVKGNLIYFLCMSNIAVVI